MPTRDPAFLWETEVLRSTPRSTSDAHSRGKPADVDWLTLREASQVTGVPASTIRKWARHENIPSFMEQTKDGRRRLVSLEGIERWADEIGREIERADRTRVTSPRASSEGTHSSRTVADLTEAESDESIVPEGSMLVPLDAWNRMLNQLGNLHEAGQQLAEARERAAKAETEARFLKERLADLRRELDRAKEPPAPMESKAEQPRGPSEKPQEGTSSLIRKAYRGWRQRRNRPG